MPIIRINLYISTNTLGYGGGVGEAKLNESRTGNEVWGGLGKGELASEDKSVKAGREGRTTFWNPHERDLYLGEKKNTTTQ